MSNTMTRRATFGLAAGFAALIAPVAASAACNDQDEANMAIVTRWVEDVLNGGNFDLITELVDPNYDPTDPELAPGADAWRSRLEEQRQSSRETWPDFRITVEDMFATDGRVVVRSWMQGTAATGAVLKALRIDIYHLANNRITTGWGLYDLEAALESL